MPAPKDRIYKRKDGRFEGRYTVYTPDGQSLNHLRKPTSSSHRRTY